MPMAKWGLKSGIGISNLEFQMSNGGCGGDPLEHSWAPGGYRHSTKSPKHNQKQKVTLYFEKFRLSMPWIELGVCQTGTATCRQTIAIRRWLAITVNAPVATCFGSLELRQMSDGQISSPTCSGLFGTVLRPKISIRNKLPL